MRAYNADWAPAPRDAAQVNGSLHSGTVHVWRCPVAAVEKHGDALYRTLSAEERTRADRFYREADRHRFIAGRAMLRDVLARYLAVRASAVEFDYGPYGKPALRSPDHDGISFNLSHSGDWTVCAVAPGSSIGIDLESMSSQADITDLARLVFSPREHRLFLRYPASVRRERFFEAWSSKEAYIKAIGKGLSCPMPEVEILFEKGVPCGVMASPGWRVRRIDVAQGYAGAIAVDGVITAINFYDWHPLPDGTGDPGRV